MAPDDRHEPAYAHDDATADHPTPVVGIGASAGGLEALEALFRAVPPNAAVAWLVVVHLDPARDSLLPELLGRTTSLTVEVATDGEPIRPRRVYVIPPGATMTLHAGRVRLTRLGADGAPGLAADELFRSLAADRQARSVAIVLSGTGTDGTMGLRAIKGAGGMTMAQDESAQHGGMPQSAVAAGVVDFVLPPDRMPAALLGYLERRQQQGWAEEPPDSASRLRALQQILVLLKARTGHDFSHYKTTTIYRRVERRMALHRLDSLDDYVEYLQVRGEEARALFGELLISVTSFFRDPEAFESLKAPFLAELLDRKPAGEVVRVWVPGCSTGEEPYSVAMALLEVATELDVHAELQIFATDIDERAIEVARAGYYPDSIRADLSAARLRRFFTPVDGGGFRVSKALRESLVLAPQSVVRDPPFSNLDLVSCRNLLIYLDPVLQRRVLAMLHYGLRPDGLLLLGSFETIGLTTELFDPLDPRWKLFRRRPLRSARSVVPPIPADEVQPMPHSSDETFPQRQRAPGAAELVRAVLQQSNAPPCAVIDDEMQVVFVHGSTGRFLEPAEGTPSDHLLDMARPGLRTALATCVRTALRTREPSEQRGVVFPSNGDELTADIVVRPVVEPPRLAHLTVVFFERRTPPAPSDDEQQADAGEGSDRDPTEVRDLERELADTKANLQSTIEELETANEELRSSNEELQSTNEELQSANEELETSQEELQSLNEETGIVNAELQSRVEELMRANDDLDNLLLSTGVATIFLDTKLRVRRFTPGAAELFPLTRSDEGRPLSHLASSLLDVDVEGLTNAMLDDLVVREREVAAQDGRHFMMRIRPYRTVHNVIDGAVLTFEDRTEIHHAVQAVREESAHHGAQVAGPTEASEDPDGGTVRD